MVAEMKYSIDRLEDKVQEILQKTEEKKAIQDTKVKTNWRTSQAIRLIGNPKKRIEQIEKQIISRSFLIQENLPESKLVNFQIKAEFPAQRVK